MTPLRRALPAVLTLALTLPISVRAQVDPPQTMTEGGSYGQRGQGRNGMGRGVRGTVVSASGTNVTLKSETGETWTVVTTDNTRVNIDRLPVKVTDLHAGDEVVAMGVLDPDKHEVHALMVAGASAAQVAKLKADLGKTYIVGRITAINDTKLTIERPDHVSQTITLDETTSLKRGGRMPAELMAGGMFGANGGRRGNREAASTNNENSGGMPQGMEGESITMADLKVGDRVAGTGSVKNGSFVPTDLRVMVRRPGRGPRPNDGGVAGDSAGTGAPQQP